jgi:hypothetical protein
MVNAPRFVAKVQQASQDRRSEAQIQCIKRCGQVRDPITVIIAIRPLQSPMRKGLLTRSTL